MGCSAMFARSAIDLANGYGGWSEDDGGWAGDTWYRRGAPFKAGGPRFIRVCRSLKGKGQRPGLAANHLVDTLWSVAAGGVADFRSAGPGGSRGAAGRRSAQKANSLVRALGACAR
ncbi:hypothetical protein EVAR_50381_1 [Eumeta japonica]|uniref:Uncharacterized protein n=1 Tax=Eumeta variegata TaxID=151549 RepID=A0A4C1XXC8_EUMVA|nr:hypothetical protein EVAR_50381_1 [Eumeta japonica]